MDPLLERQRLIRRNEYERMGEAGLFEGERVELIHGVIVEMSPRSVGHDQAIQRLTRWLAAALAGRADVRVQLSFRAGEDSMPEPDLAVVDPSWSEADAHPDDALLIVEVANASLPFDRGIKAELYAQEDIREYWVVNLVDRAIERYTEPAAGAYARVTTHRPGEHISPLAFSDVSLGVADILGR